LPEPVTPVTKEDLLRYIPLKREIEVRQERIVRMRSHEQYPEMHDASESQHVASATDSTAKAIEARLEYTDTTDQLIAQNWAEIRRIETAVDALSNPLERQVILLRYMSAEFCRMPLWSAIAMRMYGNDDRNQVLSCFRLHKTALANLLCPDPSLDKIDQVKIQD